MFISYVYFLTVGRSFFIMNNSNLLKLAQMYEFTAETVQAKKKWEKSIENATNSMLQNGRESNNDTVHYINKDSTCTMYSYNVCAYILLIVQIVYLTPAFSLMIVSKYERG